MLLARVLFINPVKTFINKRGVESKLMSMEIADRSGVMECTMFSEAVDRF